MAKLYFIRHGLADKGWSEDLDPGLAPQGKTQAEARARALATALPKKDAQPQIISSPLRRCQETALPLARLWKTTPTIVNAVSEIPTPPRLRLKDKTLLDRTNWLRSIMNQSWHQLANEASLLLWKKHLLDWVFHRDDDCVVFSHFVAINVLLGAALDDDRFIVAQPNHCSLWVFNNDGGSLALLQEGEQVETKVL